MKPRLLALFILLLASPAAAYAEQWVPYQLRPDQTELRVWTSQGTTFARVRIGFNNSGYRVVDWGTVERNGNNFSVNVVAEEWTGASLQVITIVENGYTLGELGGGTFTFTLKSRGTPIKSQTFDPVQAGQGWGPATLPPDRVHFNGFAPFGEGLGVLTLQPPDTGYEVGDWGQAVREDNNFTIDLKLDRFQGPGTATRINSVQRRYPLGPLPTGTYTATIKIRGQIVKVVTFTIGLPTQPTNPIDRPEFFTRQHYLDFLNREPDPAGFGFWQGQILACGGVASCVAEKRVHVSGAFFRSIEFNETGFLVLRLYKAGLGRAPSLAEFLADARELGRGLVVGEPGWEQKIEANKTAFVNAFAARAEFAARLPETLTPEQFVDALNANTKEPAAPAGPESVSLTAAERDALAAALRSGAETRAAVLRKVAENAEFTRKQTNRAFVHMQYFGYLRREPDEAGFRFWLQKLTNHNGDFVSAEMVKSFLDSSEYRGRFVQQ